MAHAFLKKISAIWLIATFLLCNTPVNVLHYLFANHQDQTEEITYNRPNPQIYKSGISCHLIGNVVTEPFVAGEPIKISVSPIIFHEHHEAVHVFFHQLAERSTSLRAPPALV